LSSVEERAVCPHTHGISYLQTGLHNRTLPRGPRLCLEKSQEIAERWPFDGIEIDFARGVVFPPNQRWVNRDQLTAFMHRLRQCLQEITAARGRADH
jgi:hypothetical protein